jgi:hypothetical protein
MFRENVLAALPGLPVSDCLEKIHLWNLGVAAAILSAEAKL